MSGRSAAETIAWVGLGILVVAAGLAILASGGAVAVVGIGAVTAEASLLAGAFGLVEGLANGGLIGTTGHVTSFFGGVLIGGVFGGC